MDWIKINTALPRSPKVVRLASLMGVSEREALGLALEWFCWLDSATADGSTGLHADEIDRVFTCHASSVTGVSRFSDALAQIGWIFEDENGIICASDFDQHNGDSAKKRAQATKRQNAKRAKERHASCVTEVSRKQRDQRREEKIYKKEDSSESSKKPQKEGKILLPETSDEVLTYIAALPNCGLTGEELTACVETFFNQSEAVGWTLNGQPVRDWRASARAFLAKWQNNIASRAAAAPRTGKITYRSETRQNYEL